jgi:hypothetical protein
VLSVIGAVILLEVLPYIEELIRGLRANKGSLAPPAAALPLKTPVGAIARKGS